MFRPLARWQKLLYKDIGDWYAIVNPQSGKLAGDPYYALAASNAPGRLDLTPEVENANIAGRTKETNIFTLDDFYTPNCKQFSTTAYGAVGTTQQVHSVTGLAVGDTVFFPKQSVYAVVLGIATGGYLTLSVTVSTSGGDPVVIPQVGDGWAFICKSPGNMSKNGVWYVQGNPQTFEHLLPHQKFLMKRGNVARGMPLS